MSKTNDGGPAFPIDGEAFRSDYTGMTLRDYFAAMAMQSYLSGPHFDGGWTDEEIASWSYKTADAMLRAREEG